MCQKDQENLPKRTVYLITDSISMVMKSTPLPESDKLLFEEEQVMGLKLDHIISKNQLVLSIDSSPVITTIHLFPSPKEYKIGTDPMKKCANKRFQLSPTYTHTSSTTIIIILMIDKSHLGRKIIQLSEAS